jgi:cellulose biosynthesis protein BcsQ
MDVVTSKILGSKTAKNESQVLQSKGRSKQRKRNAMSKVISVFNHKGGVSKTTTVYHLGWMMANKGKKVLIVDADPQCNLTGLTLGLEDYDSLSRFYESKKNTDIYESLAPSFSIDNEISAQSKSITPTKNENLFILAGNIRLSELDIQIATAMTSSIALPVLRKFVGAFNNLIQKVSKENDIDIVLVDMSPSVSATNQSILMSSDYFIIPISPDFYCYQAIDSLSNVLPKWANDSNSFRGNSVFSLPTTNPKMLGFISQNYRVYTVDSKDNNDQKTMSKSYADWLEKIKDLSNKTLIPSLTKADMVIDESIFKRYVDYDSPYHLAGIQNFNAMIPTSQKLSKPMFELTQSDGGWGGAPWYRKDANGKEHGTKVNIEEAKAIFERLATSIIGILDNT